MKFLSKKSLIVGIITLLILGSGYLVVRAERGDGEVNGTSLLKEIEFEKTGVRFIPNGWKEFRSELYGFSILYKDALSVKQFEEVGGASTFTFENSSSTVGFQLFVVPYGEGKITDERFYKDSPLGIRENSKDLDVDGVTSASFYGRDQTLGDTYEVWFIRNGLLYEVSTPRALEAWLSSIIETWLFL